MAANEQKRAVRPLPEDVKQALLQGVRKAGSQLATAAELGISTTTLSFLLNDSYVGDTDGMATRIRGQYMKETVECPVMGDLSTRHCLDYQTRPLAQTNPTRARLYKACKTCPNRKA